MFEEQKNRREFLKAVAAGAVVVGGSGWAWAAPQRQSDVPEITMTRNYSIGRYHFDPLGLYVEVGQTVRFVSLRDGFSATAYHPDNDNHELRIPEGAEPFDSGILWTRESIEYTCEIEGTYDFYSRNQETIGAVGRIVAGKPGGPGEKPLGYGSREGWAPIYREVIRTLELAPSEEIVRQKVIRYPMRGPLSNRFPHY
jgi:plastocyanin